MVMSGSRELLGDLSIRVLPQDYVETENFRLYLDGSSTSNTFIITIIAKHTRAVLNEGEGLDSDAQRPRLSVTFWNSFSLPVDTLVGGGIAACDAVDGMLSEVHVPQSDIAVSHILESGSSMANDRQANDQRVFHMLVFIDAFVDELPTPFENDNYLLHNENITTNDNNDNAWEIQDGHDHYREEVTISDEDFYEIVELLESGGQLNDDDDHRDEAYLISFDDYSIRFEPASKESIEGLEKVRIEVPEKAVGCPVCLDDILVGSEATRLPCSHLYHGDCIVKWLQKSKFCPLCRFQMPA